jgi:hypothetical protein
MFGVAAAMLADMAVGPQAGLRARQSVITGAKLRHGNAALRRGDSGLAALAGTVCPVTCAASAASNCDGDLASAAGFAAPLPPTEAGAFEESSWSDSHDAPLAIENTAPMTPPIATSGNMQHLP